MPCHHVDSRSGRGDRPSSALLRHADEVADAELALYRSRFMRYLASRLEPEDLEREWQSYREMQRHRVIVAALADEDGRARGRIIGLPRPGDLDDTEPMRRLAAG